jgi:hypothetical protein
MGPFWPGTMTGVPPVAEGERLVVSSGLVPVVGILLLVVGVLPVAGTGMREPVLIVGPAPVVGMRLLTLGTLLLRPGPWDTGLIMPVPLPM